MRSNSYITAHDVARKLGVARYRVYEWVRDGQIPYLRTVGRILFDPAEVEQWLRRDRNGSNPNVSQSNSVIGVEV